MSAQPPARRSQQTPATSRGSMRKHWQPALLALLIVGCAPAVAPAPAGEDGPAMQESAYLEAEAWTDEVEAAVLAAPAPEPMPESEVEPKPVVEAEPAPADPVLAPAPVAAATPAAALAPKPPVVVQPALAAATLTVRNGTRDHLVVQLDGASVATLAPGRSTQLRALEPGHHRLRASSRSANVRHTATVTARSGSVHRWDIEQRYGRLTVRNERSRSARVHVDGSLVGAVSARSTRTFTNVPEGSRSVTVTGALGEVLRQASRQFAANATVRLTLAPRVRPGALEVLNRARSTVHVTMDGHRLGQVAPRSTARFVGLEPGVHTFASRSVARPRHEQRIDVLQGRTTRWEVLEAAATLRVVNRGPRPVVVTADGRRLGRVPSGAARQFPVEAGRTHLVATTPRGRRVDAETVLLRSGARQRWTVDFGPAPAAVSRGDRMRQERERREHQEAQARRERERQERQERQEAQARRERERQERQERQEAQARQERERRERQEAQVRQERERKAAAAKQAKLVVVNRSSESVAVQLDGRALGQVPAGSRRTFTGQSVGKHVVSAKGSKTGARASQSVALGAKGATVSFDLPEPRSSKTAAKAPRTTTSPAAGRKPSLPRPMAVWVATKPGPSRVKGPSKARITRR